MADNTRFKALEKIENKLQHLQQFTVNSHGQLIEAVQRQEEQHKSIEELKAATAEWRSKMETKMEQLQAKTEHSIARLTEQIQAQTEQNFARLLDSFKNPQGKGASPFGSAERQEKIPSPTSTAPIPDSASLEPAIEARFQTIEQEIEATVPISVEKHGTEIVEVFSKLNQEDDLEEYDHQFEQLRLGMLFYNPYLPESYFTSCYINGLKSEIHSLVKLGRPKDLTNAMELAMFHNKSIQGSVDRDFEVFANGVLGDLEPDLAKETILPNDMSPELDDYLEEPHTQHFKVTSNPTKIVILDVASKEQGYMLTDSIGIESDELELEIISIEMFENLIAPKVFVVMSAHVESFLAVATSIVKGRLQDENLIFDPGISKFCIRLSNFLKNCVHTDLEGSKFRVLDDNVDMDCGIDKDRAIGMKVLYQLDYNRSVDTPLFCLKFNRGQPKLSPDIGRVDLEETIRNPIRVPFDRGKDSINVFYVQWEFGKPTCDIMMVVILFFDPGGTHGWSSAVSAYLEALLDV